MPECLELEDELWSGSVQMGHYILHVGVRYRIETRFILKNYRSFLAITLMDGGLFTFTLSLQVPFNYGKAYSTKVDLIKVTILCKLCLTCIFAALILEVALGISGTSYREMSLPRGVRRIFLSS